jgi:uncharacterized protein YkwD
VRACGTRLGGWGSGGVLESEDAGSGVPRIERAAVGVDPRCMRKMLLGLLGLLASFALLSAPALSQAAGKVSFETSGEQQVLVLLNQIRAQHGLGALSASAPLHAAARFHSADMLQHGYFEHDGLNESWDARIARYLKSSALAETIAWGSGSYGSPAGIVSMWMHSPPHRAIILTAGLHRVGLGLALGSYAGTPGAVMATADFAA